MSKVEIDRAEEFEVLPKAPITEAALEIRARVSVCDWEEEAVRRKLSVLLPEYVGPASLHSYQAAVEMRPGSHPPVARADDLGWNGLRVSTPDKLQIARFSRDSFGFSRLAPYSGWLSFEQESFRLWTTHKEIAKPEEISRIGLRFINRLVVPQLTIKIEDYLVSAPKEPNDWELPLLGFYHRDAYGVPDTDYQISITRTVQDEGSTGVALLIDIDVAHVRPILVEESACLQDLLREMRWLKNKAFFGSITEKAKLLIQ
jgi:uncharacterized protein (TIGR04255 family)